MPKNTLPTEEITPLTDVSDKAMWYDGAVTKDSKTDYIFSNAKAVSGTLTCHKDKKGDVYLSDHYPVSVIVEML